MAEAAKSTLSRVDFPQFIPHNGFGLDRAELTDSYAHFLTRGKRSGRKRGKRLPFLGKCDTALQIPAANEVLEKALVGFTAGKIAAGSGTEGLLDGLFEHVMGFIHITICVCDDLIVFCT